MAIDVRETAEDIELILSSATIQARVRALARRLRRDYAGHDLVVVGVLKGAFVFLADLVRALRLPVTIGFVGLSSYGASTTPSTVRITVPLDVSITGRDVLVVEDILDTGRSMRVLLDALQADSPRSLRVCALLDKPERRQADVAADYVGFAAPAGFVVGYGIDYAERYRYLPEIYRLAAGGPS